MRLRQLEVRGILELNSVRKLIRSRHGNVEELVFVALRRDWIRMFRSEKLVVRGLELPADSKLKKVVLVSYASPWKQLNKVMKPFTSLASTSSSLPPSESPLAEDSKADEAEALQGIQRGLAKSLARDIVCVECRNKYVFYGMDDDRFFMSVPYIGHRL